MLAQAASHHRALTADVSIGAATVKEGDHDGKIAIRVADAAMYDDKRRVR